MLGQLKAINTIRIKLGCVVGIANAEVHQA